MAILSDKPNLFLGRLEKRIGKAIIERIKIRRVKHLSEEEAKQCGSKNLRELKSTLKK